MLNITGLGKNECDLTDIMRRIAHKSFYFDTPGINQ